MRSLRLYALFYWRRETAASRAHASELRLQPGCQVGLSIIILIVFSVSYTTRFSSESARQSSSRLEEEWIVYTLGSVSAICLLVRHFFQAVTNHLDLPPTELLRRAVSSSRALETQSSSVYNRVSWRRCATEARMRIRDRHMLDSFPTRQRQNIWPA